MLIIYPSSLCKLLLQVELLDEERCPPTKTNKKLAKFSANRQILIANQHLLRSPSNESSWIQKVIKMSVDWREVLGLLDPFYKIILTAMLLHLLTSLLR